jgi:hypothetical protein
LQALSDGGLVLGIPFLFGCCVIALFVLSGLASAVRHRDYSVGSFALPLALGAMLAHSFVDFDWSYPADFVLVAVLAGVVAGRRWIDRPNVVSARRLTACAVLVGVVTLGISAAAAWSGDMKLSLPVAHAATGAVR